MRKPAVLRCLAFAAAALSFAGCGSSSPSNQSATGSGGGASASAGSGNFGTTINRAVPASLRRLPLTNQDDKRVTLSAWPGRTILLVPFLTLCQDICPMTTGNLLQLTQTLRADHAGSKVQIVELTVDPGRDTPARLAAYRRAIQDAAPDFHGKLNPKLYGFLDALGRQHLKHVPQPDWTPGDALKALSVSVGRPL